jgi:hypothetical protein
MKYKKKKTISDTCTNQINIENNNNKNKMSETNYMMKLPNYTIDFIT